VGIKAIQECIGAVSFYKATQGMVVTNSQFTSQAKNLADASNIELWNRQKLISIMSKVQGKKLINESIQKSMEKEPKTINVKNNEIIICPSCGGELVKRTGKNGLFFGCSNFPECKYSIKRLLL
jgi:restriction system protein